MDERSFRNSSRVAPLTAPVGGLSSGAAITAGGGTVAHFRVFGMFAVCALGHSPNSLNSIGSVKPEAILGRRKAPVVNVAGLPTFCCLQTLPFQYTGWFPDVCIVTKG